MRGLSDRDIEAALRESLGPDATISKSTVSRICEAIKDQFDTWRTRDLTDVSIDYLFVGFLQDMVARGLGWPVLTVTDGAPGLCAAIDQVSPLARRQRCLIHRSRNALAKAVDEARRRARQFADTWGRTYPGAVVTVIAGLDELVAHLHYPRAHWPRIRHTNLISSGPSAKPDAG